MALDTSAEVGRALGLQNGAHFWVCALQVNPFEYVRRHSKGGPATDEASYNEATVHALLEADVQCVAITDHYRIATSETLIRACEAAGLTVFPGFEAATKEGVHFLCFFNPGTSPQLIERRIGECGVSGDGADSPLGKHDSVELLELIDNWGGVAVAAHIAGSNGLLQQLKGQARATVWKSPRLIAVSVPGQIEDVQPELQPILRNVNPDYQRPHPVAVINASDVSGPTVPSGAITHIKMTAATVDGLRQAFLDPDSRIRLASDPAPSEHTEFVALTWLGGFLDGVAIRWNENLNVLVGGRGAGKSTVVESLRYVLGLEPIGDEGRRAHEGVVKSVLRSGTKVSLVVDSYRPSPKRYLIERTVPNPPTVRDEVGNVLAIAPAELVPGVEVFGQHEISELSRSPQKLTRLLRRFVTGSDDLLKKKGELKKQLARSRQRLLDLNAERREAQDRLASLPAVEETLRRFEEAGLEERLRDQTMLVREQRVIQVSRQRLQPLRSLLEELNQALPVDSAFVSEAALKDLPAIETLQPLRTTLDKLSNDLSATVGAGLAAVAEAEAAIVGVDQRWATRRVAVEAAYERILRELQRTRVDGEEFLRLRRQLEDLRPLAERMRLLDTQLRAETQERRNLLAEWSEVRTEEFQQLARAAKRVTRQLTPRVRVTCEFEGNREPLGNLLREDVGGRLGEAIEILKAAERLSLADLAEAARKGRSELATRFRLPPVQADRISSAGEETLLKLEELELPATTSVELNVASEDESPVWQDLDSLSTGQRATAVLLLLLLESDAPLVVDQPEDDLDNRFIADAVVPKMRFEKRRRQFVFTTHNANVPVLGDAELILGLTAAGEATAGHATIANEHRGSIDIASVRDLVEELLEGGQEAFEMRRLKYGF